MERLKAYIGLIILRSVLKCIECALAVYLKSLKLLIKIISNYKFTLKYILNHYIEIIFHYTLKHNYFDVD